MFQKLKKRIDNMSEITKTRLFALLVVVIMGVGFFTLHKNKSDSSNSKIYRHYIG